MQRIIAVSDIHGFYDELMIALKEVKFNPETDLFCSLGDEIDRGPKPNEVINFILSLPNRVIIKGNHTDLFQSFCQRGYPLSHDWSNGTSDSILNLAPYSKTWDAACPIALEKMQPLIDQMVNYYETQHYIFVHSFIPLKSDNNLFAYRTNNKVFKYNPNWREAHASEWENARWGNPFDLAQDGLNQTGKIIVHGHYHNSLGWVYKTHGALSEFGQDAKFDICEHENCIGLDACTAYSGKVNVLVIEDELLEDN